MKAHILKIKFRGLEENKYRRARTKAGPLRSSLSMSLQEGGQESTQQSRVCPQISTPSPLGHSPGTWPSPGEEKGLTAPPQVAPTRTQVIVSITDAAVRLETTTRGRSFAGSGSPSSTSCTVATANTDRCSPWSHPPPVQQMQWLMIYRLRISNFCGYVWFQIQLYSSLKYLLGANVQELC